MGISLYNYKATVTEVIDSDTILADIDVGLDVQLNNQVLRFKSINSPESYLGKDVFITTYKSEVKSKYGRYLADVFLLDSAQNIDRILYNYKATVIRVVDGDTIRAKIDVGLDAQLNNQILRLKGINAPEMHGEAKDKGMISRDYLTSLISNKDVIITTYKSRTKDKYGRYLAEIFLPDSTQSVNQKLLDGGFAIFYDPD